MNGNQPFGVLSYFAYAFLVLGLATWTMAGFAPTYRYPEFFHFLLLGPGFLFSLAAAILITEAYRAPFAASPPRGPVALLLSGLLGLAVAALLRSALFAYAFHAACLAILAKLLWPRMRASLHQPGPAFAFAAAVATFPYALAGVASEAGLFPKVLGRAFVEAGFQGFFLLFCAACLRWSRAVAPKGRPRDAWIAASASALAIILGWEALASLGLLPESNIGMAYFLKIVWIGWFLPRSRELRSIFNGSPGFDRLFRVGYVFLLAGVLLAAWRPDRAIDFTHIAFLAGFVWMAMVAATAVITRDTETRAARSRSALMLACGASIGAAALLRAAAAYFPAWRNGILTGSMLLALLPLTLWITFIPFERYGGFFPRRNHAITGRHRRPDQRLHRPA